MNHQHNYIPFNTGLKCSSCDHFISISEIAARINLQETMIHKTGDNAEKLAKMILKYLRRVAE